MAEIDYSQPLSNPQHEVFAQLIAGGMDATDAYRKLNPDCKPRSQIESACRLSTKVNQRVVWLQKQSTTATTMSMQERRELLGKHGRREDIETRDLVAVVLADAKLAGELIDKAEVKILNPITPADVLNAMKRIPELQGIEMGRS